MQAPQMVNNIIEVKLKIIPEGNIKKLQRPCPLHCQGQNF